MEKMNLFDLCILAESLQVDFYRLTYEEGDKIYRPNSTGSIEAGVVDVDFSQIEYRKLYVLIRVLQDIYAYRPLPF